MMMLNSLFTKLRFTGWVSLLLALALSLSGCTIGREQLTEEVKTSMQQKFDQESRFKEFALQVKELMLFKEDGSHYSGLAQVQYKGSLYPVKLKVKVDGYQYMWETEDDAFNFVVQHELNQIGQDFLKNLDASQD